MNKFIAYCGLDCETCEARLATINNDNGQREKVAKLWSELNGVEITPEMINCVGCRIDGPKTPYCESLCPIRQCALSKNIETCGSCPEMESCEKVGAIISNNKAAYQNLLETAELSTGITMFELNIYLDMLVRECQSAFEDRLCYIGLQGSYLRGEANENSDIDVMVILDRFSVNDMDIYRDILKKIGNYEKSCGFICGKEEMAHWNPLEVCQQRNTTKDIYGSLTDFLPPAAREDEINYVKLSLGNLYHELCHRYIHADRAQNILKFRKTCKFVFFLVQNLHYLESGTFVLTKRELKERVSQEDREVLELSDIPDGFDFDQAFLVLFDWCQRAFFRVK